METPRKYFVPGPLPSTSLNSEFDKHVLGIQGDGQTIQVSRFGQVATISVSIEGLIARIPKHGGLQLKWGSLKTAWTPGTNVVTLTPCKGMNNATPISGAADIQAVISFPQATPAVCFPEAVGAIMAYVGTGDATNPWALFNPKLLPTPTAPYQGVFNTATGGQPANYQADYVRADNS